jgi:tetratricopeptide (TPR) repeat protein
MSSALFLSRALEIFPEYAYFKIDLEGMMDDRDNLEGRIADIEEWLKIRNRGELHFLLGYVYYQIGRLERAMESIEAAYEMMPNSAIVAILRKAIYGTQKETPVKSLSI